MRVVQQFGIVLAPHELAGDLGKAGDRGIEGVDPERYAFGRLGLFDNILPPPAAQHFPFVLIGDNAAALLAGVHGHFRAVCAVRHIVLAGPFDAGKFQLDKLSAMRTRDEIVLDHLRPLHGPPDMPAFQRRCAGHENFSVEDRKSVV